MGVTKHHLNHCVGYRAREEGESLLGTGCRPGEGLGPPCWMVGHTQSDKEKCLITAVQAQFNVL